MAFVHSVCGVSRARTVRARACPQSGRRPPQWCMLTSPDDAPEDSSRRLFLQRAALGLAAALLPFRGAAASAADASETPPPRAGAGSPSPPQPTLMTLKSLPSGVRFVDIQEGSGEQPSWGDLAWILYTTYVVLPGEVLERVDSCSFRENEPYMLKHGNGQTVMGLEEALHSMRVGGRRRAIIPPQLSYVGSDLGPLPNWYLARKKLSRKLDEARNLVVFDIELVRVAKDERDRGYYTDLTPTPEQWDRFWEGKGGLE